MRELSVRIRFTTPCLGKEKRHYRDPVSGKTRYKFIFTRAPASSKVVFLPTWWRSIILKAAELSASGHVAAGKIRFGCELDGQPQRELYRRYYSDTQFSAHEVFAAGAVVGATCVVPHEISDEEFERLLSCAGKYFGISPARPNEFGYFEVVNIQRIGRSRTEQQR
jgi:hypothetical protein